MHPEPFRVGAKARGVRVQPFERGERILDRRRKFVLRPHPVIDRDDQRRRAVAQIARDQVMRVEAADHMAAAMIIGDCRHAVLAWRRSLSGQ